jgi:tripartite-type tricarboxylate transporter receptor subunit TctC
VTRVTAAELEKVLGQKIVVVNQPGASGSIGTKSAWEAAKDGYTWAAGAAQTWAPTRRWACSTCRPRSGTCSSTWPTCRWSASTPATPYQNMTQLLDAMKAKPGEIKVATAGVTSGGHNAMELIAKATGVKYRHVTYDGGNPAAVATVAARPT